MRSNAKVDIAIAGLAVMGANLVLNIEKKGFYVAVFNRSVEKMRQFMETTADAKNFIDAEEMRYPWLSYKVKFL